MTRQPVCTAELELAGYELILAGGARMLEAGGTSAVARATAESALDELVGALPAHLTLPRETLLGDVALPPDRVVLAVAEPAPAGGELRAALARLAAAGHRIALAGDALAAADDELLALAAIARLEAGALAPDQLAERADALAGHGLATLAAGVDDRAAYERARAAGCALLQGAFVAAPRASEPVAGGIGKVRLLSALEQPDVSFEELEELIAHDVGLSFRLLRLVNSAHFGVRRRIDTVHDAFVLLGVANVRRWATLAVLAGLPDTPSPLVVTALVRARTCELLARGGASERRRLYTIGLFSLIDAFLGEEMQTALARLPFSDEMHAALLRHEGPAGRLLASVVAWERGEPARVDASVAAPEEVAAAYREALGWADRTVQALE